MSLDTLTRPLTREEVEAAIYAALAARGVSTTGWKPGAVVRAIITGVSVVVASASRLQAAIARGGFLELADGEWLTIVARYVYDVERDQGSFATGSVTLTNAGGGIFAGDPGDLVVRSTEGKLYRSTESFSLAPTSTTTVTVRAVELGADSTAAPSTLTALETPLLGVSVTNPTALVGTDEETDEQLRLRCRERTGILSPNGPRDAYTFVARSTRRADGTSIGVTRVLAVPDGTGTIDVYVARADGTVTGTASDPATDLGAIADAIHRQAEPLGVTPVVQSATALPIAVTYTLWVRDTSGLTTEQIVNRVQARLINFMASQPIGGEVITAPNGFVFLDAIETVIGATMEPWLVDVQVTLPTANVSVGASQAPVLGAVVPTIVQLPRGLT
jgi:phage-related baseplate assembly protein